MKIEITGSRCINCNKYTQYYTHTWNGGFDPIDCGFCGMRQCTTRPGNRCKHYREAANVSVYYPIEKTLEGKKDKCIKNF